MILVGVFERKVVLTKKRERVKKEISVFRLATALHEGTGMSNFIGDFSYIAYAADFSSCGHQLNCCSKGRQTLLLVV